MACRQNLYLCAAGIAFCLLLSSVSGCGVFTSSSVVIPTGFWDAYQQDVQTDDGQVLGESQHGFRFLNSAVAEDEEGNLRWQWSCTFTNTGSSVFGGALNYVLYDRDGNEVTSEAAYTGRILPGESRVVGGLATLKRLEAARVREGRWIFATDEDEPSLSNSESSDG
jgi:hypothetical protein